jgi:hypothetical protein
MKRTARILLLAMGTLVLTRPVRAQAGDATKGSVRLQFEIDGKRVDTRFKIFVYIDGATIEPLRFENGFVVPPLVSSHETAGVRLLFAGHNLYFEHVSRAQFGADWIVGIDHYPFRFAEVEDRQLAKKLKVVYYIKFESGVGDGVILSVLVRKKTSNGR